MAPIPHWPVRASRLFLVTLAAGVACGEPTAAGPGSLLLGRWVADAAPIRPSGSHQRSLTFTSPGLTRVGRFTAEWRSYGTYPGQAPGELSAYARTVGVYRVDGDRVAFAPTALITWDRFYGADSRPTTLSPYPYGAVYDDARFAVTGGVLTLDYRGIGPADESVQVTERLRRAD